MAWRYKINLATPCYGDVFTGAYVSSLYHLLYAAQREGVAIAHTGLDYADIEVSRNYLLTSFYYGKPDCSHLLFVDADMGFPPQLVFDMLALDEPIVGAFYPARQLDLETLHASAALPFDEALRRATAFVGAPHPSGDRQGDFLRASLLGTGIMLISREAVARMIDAMPRIAVPGSACELPGHRQFPHFLKAFTKLSANGRPLSEDYSFCWRWTEGCGEKLWAAPHHRLSHTGQMAFEGAFGALPAEAGMAATEA